GGERVQAERVLIVELLVLIPIEGSGVADVEAPFGTGITQAAGDVDRVIIDRLDGLHDSAFARRRIVKEERSTKGPFALALFVGDAHIRSQALGKKIIERQ